MNNNIYGDHLHITKYPSHGNLLKINNFNRVIQQSPSVEKSNDEYEGLLTAKTEKMSNIEEMT